MKRVICSFIVALTLIFASCVKRTTIPDEELALIFRDAFLANAYIFSNDIVFDTLQVYQPIFDRYGYSAEDVAYTVGSFSKRKSARLSDVVERSIKMLEEGQKIYSHETMILDSIDLFAQRDSKRVILERELVEYHQQRDSVNILFELDSLQPGSYDISFEYLVDTLDNNRSSYRVMSWSEAPNSDVKRGVSSSFLRKNMIQRFTRNVEIDTLTHKFVIKLAESYEVKRSPHVTFRKFKVEYTPLVDESVERFYRKMLDVRIFADDFFWKPELQSTDSLVVSAL
ncbi:MAG: DUF4296 domain-containing protein [Rikenellaceae bacterium]